MAISLIVGTPGAGKSYLSLALAIIPACKLGRPVVTNIPLKCAEIEKQVDAEVDYRPIETITADWWATIPGGALVVIDEAEQVFPSGVRANMACASAREWIAMHRHHVGDVQGQAVSCDLVLVTQGAEDLSRWLRSKIDKTYMVRKLDALGVNRYQVRIYQGFQDTKPKRNSQIDSRIGKYEDKVTRCYKSHTLAASDGVTVAELKPMSRNIFKTGRAYAFGGLLLVALVIPLAFGKSSYEGMFGAQPETDPAWTKKPTEAGMNEPEITSVTVKPQPREHWRIAGWMKGEGEQPTFYLSLQPIGRSVYGEGPRVNTKHCTQHEWGLECDLLPEFGIVRDYAVKGAETSSILEL